jgi:alanyl-tRNA synthetase
VHFGVDTSTLDIDAASLTLKALQEIARRANEIAWENRPVTVSFESAASVARLRKTSDRTGDLRIVSIEGLDRSACGGTHVSGTSEIAPVLLRRSERAKKALRIEFVCGGRALDRAARDYATLTRLAQGVSTSIDDVVAVVEGQSAALREAEAGRRRLTEAMAQYRAKELYAAQPEDSLGVRRCIERAAQLEDVRALALAFASLPRAVYVAMSATPPALLVAASEDSGVNAGEVVKAAVTARGGRGGGSPRLAQGTVPTADALESVIHDIVP